MDTAENKSGEPFKIKGNWELQSKFLQEKYPQLTDADLKFETGKESELLSRLEARLNKNRALIMNMIEKSQQ
ncbi:MAG: hypothetical protein Q8M29_15565 [Bacteroidota bacterium]|nr:hypothetical protein [Bacteroidota bacterium]